MKNKIIAIGFMSSYRCYLNITKSEAVLRYCDSEEMTLDCFMESNYRVDEIEFDDEFGAYEIWEQEK